MTAAAPDAGRVLQLMRRARAVQARPIGRVIELPATPNGWWLPVLVNGRLTGAMVSTADRLSAVSAAEADLIGLPEDQWRYRVAIQLRDPADGRPLPVSFDAELLRAPNDNAHDGIARPVVLGRDLLRRFVRVTIQGERLTLAI